MYLLSARIDLLGNYGRVGVALLSGGWLGVVLGAWLPLATFWSGFQGPVIPPLVPDAYLYASVYTFAVGFSAAALSYFRRTVTPNSALKQKANIRRRLMSFAGFSLGTASIAIAIRLATFIGQNVVLSPINYWDSIIIGAAALLLIYKSR